MTDEANEPGVNPPPCIACGQPKDAHRKPGTLELRCPEPEVTP